MIYVSSILGGPELRGSPVYGLIGELARALNSGERPNEGSLDVVFHVPGSLVSPNFGSMRLSKFSRKERIQMIEIPVPPELVYASGLRSFLLEKLREAVEAGEARFSGTGISYPKADYIRALDEVASSTAN